MSKDWTEEEYHADRTHLSNSRLSMFIESPVTYKRWRDGEYDKPETAEHRHGRAVHCFVLEPKQFYARYPVAGVSSRNTKVYKEMAKENPDKTILLPAEMEKVENQGQAILDHAEWQKAAKGAEREKIFFASVLGIDLKCRCDLWNDGFIADIKTTRNYEQSAWERDAANYGYHRQAAFYLLVSGGYRFVHVVVGGESNEVEFRNLDSESIEIGNIEIREALEEFAECQRKDECLSRGRQGVNRCSLPTWYKANFYKDHK